MIRAYSDLERDALLDLAARTVADPNAHPEHVQAATRVLMREDLNSDALRARIVNLPPVLAHRLRALVREASAFLDDQG